MSLTNPDSHLLISFLCLVLVIPVKCLWGRRPDGVAIKMALQIVYILEFKRLTDRDEGFLEVKEAEANEQHKSIIGALRAAAPRKEFEQIFFCGPVDDR